MTTENTMLTESLKHKDMVGHVTPELGIDQFSSQIGEDSDIIVLNFIVKSKAVGDDLVDWFERGYEWIVDADISPGEVLNKKYYVFVELNRRNSAPHRIIELLNDLTTLTDLQLEDWSIKIGTDHVEADEESIKAALTLSPADYLAKSQGALNEMRELADLPTTATYDRDDAELMEMQRLARIR
jgi:hypothetical protein